MIDPQVPIQLGNEVDGLRKENSLLRERIRKLEEALVDLKAEFSVRAMDHTREPAARAAWHMTVRRIDALEERTRTASINNFKETFDISPPPADDKDGPEMQDKPRDEPELPCENHGVRGCVSCVNPGPK